MNWVLVVTVLIELSQGRATTLILEQYLNLDKVFHFLLIQFENSQYAIFFFFLLKFCMFSMLCPRMPIGIRFQNSKV